jgi:hypothetical protein
MWRARPSLEQRKVASIDLSKAKEKKKEKSTL